MGRHPHGNAIGPLHEDKRDLCREGDRLLVSSIIGGSRQCCQIRIEKRLARQGAKGASQCNAQQRPDRP